MNTKLLSIFMIAAVAAAHAGTAVHETTIEFSASGDFDGDGSGDVLVIDKATGLYRIGYGTATAGVFNFAQGRASGVTSVSGVAVGKLSGIAADSFAVTSPAQNRANILSPTTSGYTEPKAVFDAGLGPVVMAALDITGGPGSTPEDDLGIIATLNLVNRTEVRQVRSNAGTWSFLRADDMSDFTVAHGNPLVPHAGSPAIFAHLRDDGATNSLRAWSLAGTSATEVLSGAGLPDGSQFISGIFDGPNADAMAWVPGQSAVILGRIVAAGPAWTFASVTTATFASNIAQLVPVNGPSGLRVLVRFDNGTVALHAYTLAGGFSAPLPITPAGATGVLSGVVPMPGNAFQLLYAATPGGPTRSMVSFGNSGSGWNQTGITALPALEPLGIYANIMLLDDGLFRRDNVDLLRTYRFGDWATSSSVGGGPFTILATSGNYGGSAQGIGTPSMQVVGTVATSPGGTAVNQMHPQFSIFNFNANSGPQVDEVTIAPAPGTYPTAQQITFSGLLAGTTVYLRMNGGGSFQAWNPANPPWITRATTVEYYASRATGASPTRSARYSFSNPAALQDSDGDGVPDFVEIAYDMDPNGGGDSDADGFGDADELAAGTNPNNPADFPASLAPAPDSMLVDVRLRLLTVADGVVAHGKPGACTVTAEDAFGNALGSGVIGSGGVATNFGRVETVGVDAAMGFLIIRGSTHFTSVPAGANEPRGRELIGLVPALEPESWSWGTGDGAVGIATAWGWGGVNWLAGSSNWSGALGDVPGADANWSARLLDPLWDSTPTGTYSAAGWVTEFQAAMNRGAQPYAEITLTPHTSLEAVIVGKLVGDLLTQRNPATPVDGTGWKLTDVIPSGFQGLRRTDPAHPTAPVVRLNAVHRHVHDQLAAADIGAGALRKLARDVYAQHNALPTDNLDALPMPLDALADFVTTGVLPAAYLTATSLSPVERAAAAAKLSGIITTIPLRGWLAQTLYTRGTPNSPGLSLVQDGSGTPQLLLTDQLTEVALPTSAEAPAGTPLQVTAYNDIPPIAGHTALEVISLSLTSLPFIVDEDSDGDLLADNWELRHFGTLAHDGFANLDGSAYSLAQEYFEGTDPRCNTISPAVGPVVLDFDGFDIISLPPMRVRAHWPAPYAPFVNVLLESSEDLTTWNTVAPLLATDAGNGWFVRTIPADRTRRFFRPLAELKR